MVMEELEPPLQTFTALTERQQKHGVAQKQALSERMKLGKLGFLFDFRLCSVVSASQCNNLSPPLPVLLGQETAELWLIQLAVCTSWLASTCAHCHLAHAKHNTLLFSTYFFHTQGLFCVSFHCPATDIGENNRNLNSCGCIRPTFEVLCCMF